MKPERQNLVTIEVPVEAWELLRETLEMDAHSPAFDVALRRQIATALKAIRVVRDDADVN